MKMLWAFDYKETIIVVRAVDYRTALQRASRSLFRGETITSLQHVDISWKQAYDRAHPWNWQEKEVN